MKILYGITKSNFGGAQRYVFDLATEAHKKGFEVKVLCGGNGVLVKKLEAENIPVISLPTLGRDISLLNDWRSFSLIYRALIKELPDVFHINSSKMGLGALAARLVGTPKIIFTLHGFPWNEDRSYFQKIIIKFLVWLTIILSHQTICVAEQARNNVTDWPLVKNKLVVVRNGLPRFNLGTRKNVVFTVGTIAELHKIKGLDILLLAWKDFIKGREARLMIYGEGEERQNLQNMAQTLGISNSVDFKGFVLDARTYLSEFDIFVLPSRSEAMPYAPLEAGLAGVPVIATTVGGIPEIIENNISGILIPPEDSNVLSSSLVKLFEDPDLRMKLGRNLKNTVEEKFGLEKMVRDTLETYEL